MIEFPAATAVHRRLPKEAFYKHLPLTKILKEKFVSDVDRIVVENSFTKENLNLASDAEIKEIADKIRNKVLQSLYFKKNMQYNR